MSADGSGGKTALEILRERRDKARASAARELTAEEKEKIQLLAEIAQDEETSKATARALLGIALAEREERAREALGPKIPVRGILDENGIDGHSFVLRYAGSRAFAAWEDGIALSHMGTKDPKTNRKVNRADVNKAFALALVYDWNGEGITPGSDVYARLSTLFDEWGGIASTICVTGRELSGAAKEARKS